MQYRNQNIAIKTITTTQTVWDNKVGPGVDIAAAIHDAKVGEFLETSIGDLIKISTTPSLCQTECKYIYNITTTITYNVEP